MLGSAFRKRGLAVVDTTEEAERDFREHRLSEEQEERIARLLKAVPNSSTDSCYGAVRFRDVLSDYEVAFILAVEENELVVLIIGFDIKGAMESSVEYLSRAGKKALPLPVRELLEGKRRRR